MTSHQILKTAAIASVIAFNQSVMAYSLLARDIDGDPATMEAFYDPQQNITWLQNFYYSSTSPQAQNDRLNWEGAKFWANSVTINGISGWRLPKLIAPNPTTESNGAACGFVINGGACTYNPAWPVSETAILAYAGPLSVNGINIQRLPETWLDNEFDSNNSWAFYGQTGAPSQNTVPKNVGLYAILVHDGDISPVPEPEGCILATAGVLFLHLFRKNGKK